MAKNYELAGRAVIAVLNEMLQQYHPALVKEKPRIKIVMVTSDLDEGGQPRTPALKFAGLPAVAKIKVLSACDRVTMASDVLIEIDGFRWEELTPEQRRALLDHELEHLFIQVDGEGTTQRWADGQPKLGTQPDDWVLTGFAAIVERHGANALETQDLRTLRTDCQLVFEFMAEPEIPAAPDQAKRPPKTKATGKTMPTLEFVGA